MPINKLSHKKFLLDFFTLLSWLETTECRNNLSEQMQMQNSILYLALKGKSTLKRKQDNFVIN